MKIAILSDIHGNLPALTRVLQEAKKQKVTHFYVLGDQLGYYYQASEVYKILFKIKASLLAGNHEKIFLNYVNNIDTERIKQKYGGCYEYYKQEFSEELLNSIKNLPEQKELQLENYTVLFSHSNPLLVDGYIYPDESLEALKKLENANYDYIFMGHTHYPMIYSGEQTTIINVGSVGQSRIKGGVADWGILDTSNKVYVAQKTTYDSNKTIENLNMHKENTSYLHKILKR